ncbi:5-deoxy-glucuronate isomerase [Phyllobacterium sp. P30BS-XVII]|uniref:5-deoxy-glucuronate isomerase n=1 Tax=Phyllobacterium sp. P30BS-XVII TaxID=2587046 RepID=UPI0015FB422B|nr:5-deoxy-glucuronate isomerase [Phyllobacterium sp. P30BS-XVII]MBA8902940.1 5-deoxy-glucuronate isomerase [Phyllobacterium sp. P30BS-XVII]
MSSQMIRAHDNANKPIVEGDEPAKLIHFNLVKLAAGKSHTYRLSGFETAVVPLSGRCDIKIDATKFEAVGGRAGVWDGLADSVYAGPDAAVTVTALDDCEVAVAGGRWDKPMEPFRVLPEDVDMVDVGSNETKSRRRIFHILGNKQADRVGRLLVSELYADEGCWSGYPPHKHDTDQPGETAHEELYHWRFDPPTGFGTQLWYEEGQEPHAHVTRHGDTFAFSTGYHPTSTSPGHASYIFTILVGRTQRSLVQNFEERHRPLMAKIPGIDAMRAKFR